MPLKINCKTCGYVLYEGYDINRLFIKDECCPGCGRTLKPDFDNIKITLDMKCSKCGHRFKHES